MVAQRRRKPPTRAAVEERPRAKQPSAPEERKGRSMTGPLVIFALVLAASAIASGLATYGPVAPRATADTPAAATSQDSAAGLRAADMAGEAATDTAAAASPQGPEEDDSSYDTSAERPSDDSPADDAPAAADNAAAATHAIDEPATYFIVDKRPRDVRDARGAASVFWIGADGHEQHVGELPSRHVEMPDVTEQFGADAQVDARAMRVRRRSCCGLSVALWFIVRNPPVI